MKHTSKVGMIAKLLITGSILMAFPAMASEPCTGEFWGQYNSHPALCTIVRDSTNAFVSSEETGEDSLDFNRMIAEVNNFFNNINELKGKGMKIVVDLTLSFEKGDPFFSRSTSDELVIVFAGAKTLEWHRLRAAVSCLLHESSLKSETIAKCSQLGRAKVSSDVTLRAPTPTPTPTSNHRYQRTNQPEL